jgi:phosphopentomutase
VLVVVCDSFGVGAAPDAADFGDAGADTVGNASRAAGGLTVPTLEGMGLAYLTSIDGVTARADPRTAHGKQVERSAGKDTTTGHWEMMGIVLDRPFPTYPNGFPPEVIEPFEEAIGRSVLGNRAASGTEIIAELGDEHVRTGRPIVYTSADSVFQVATHVDVVPLETLYEWCRAARAILDGPHRVGRVIARPFTGSPGAFTRTPDRRDFSVPPPGDTVLDVVSRAGIPVYGVGKIRDIFDGRGLTEFRYSRSDDDGVNVTLDYLARDDDVSFVFTNLVDLDSKYGHRNDPTGWVRCLEAFDRRLPELIAAAGADGEGGLVIVTGDHGCDPTTPSTDHTREHTPLLVAGAHRDEPVDLGTRAGFSDLGATVADVLGADASGLPGRSFAGLLGP